MNQHSRLFHFRSCACVPAGLVLLLLFCQPARAQLSQFQNVIGERVEALDILGGDYGFGGGSYSANNNVDLTVSKFGGMGDVGDVRPLGNLPIGWQPRVQGSMGTTTVERKYKTGVLAGDKSSINTFAIQFGGGARFWFNDHLSLAPTFMGMYGHAYNFYNAQSAFGQANKQAAKDAGLIDWSADTWTVRPAAELAYVYTWRRTIFTASSAGTFYHTESFSTSNPNLDINGNSESWLNKLDVDVPLGVQLWGHEFRTGGYFSRTELYDGLAEGLNTDHIYEVHGRVVMDFLSQLWKVQWIGIGYSYYWGPGFNGWSAGADVAFRF